MGKRKLFGAASFSYAAQRPDWFWLSSLFLTPLRDKRHDQVSCPWLKGWEVSWPEAEKDLLKLILQAGLSFEQN